MPTSSKPVGDGLPETLAEWIPFNGLTHLKIKLNGDDLNWDVERVLGVDRVAGGTAGKRGVSTWHYSLDFNESARNVDYLLEFLGQVKDRRRPATNASSTSNSRPQRDLKADPAQRDARGVQAPARGHRRIAHRSGKPAARERDGLHRRGAEGLQGTDAIAAAGRGRARKTACSCACRT